MSPLVPLISLLIPIISIIMGIGVAMLVVFLNYRKRKEMFTLYHQERMSALDKGVDLPPLPEGFFADDQQPYNPRKHLLKGLVWLFIGLGLGAALWATFEFSFALFSLIPIGIGLAQLIYYFVEGKKEAALLEQNQMAGSKPQV